MRPLRIIALLVLASWGISGRLFAGPAVEPISSVASIRSLSREEAAKALPVKLTGVVTFLGWEDFAIHDGNASIFADFRFSKARGFWKGPTPKSHELAQGSVVEVEGVTDPGGFSPMVLVTKFRRFGEQPLPTPLRPSIPNWTPVRWARWPMR